MVQLGQNTKIQRPLFLKDGISTSVNLTPLANFNKTECGGDGGNDAARWEDQAKSETAVPIFVSTKPLDI